MQTVRKTLPIIAAAAILMAAATPTFASSHMDAPLIVLDDAANTTDVYAFVQNENGQKVLVTALGVYPFEEPGIGPNKFNFDDNVLYEIHVATGKDVAAGRKSYSYQFEFETRFKNRKTILQSFLGVIENVDDDNQNLTQYYTRHEGGPSNRSNSRSWARASFHPTTRATPPRSITRLTTARTRPRTASPRKQSSIATRVNQSRRSTADISASPVSAMTASTLISRRSSIC